MSSAHQRSFNCHACNGVIYIPYNLPPTTAPCPHCGTLLTSPAPPTAPATPEASPAPVVANPPAPQAAATASPTALAGQRPQIPSPRQSSPTPTPVLVPESEPEKKGSGIGATIVVLMLLATLGAGGWFLYQEYQKQKTTNPVKPTAITDKQPTKPEPNHANTGLVAPDDPELLQAQYNLEGWKADAAAVLQSFHQAKTPEEKAKYVIGGMATYERLRGLYGNAIMDESDTTTNAFVAIPLGDEDASRNIYLMSYDRPAQFELKKFFRPLAPIEIQNGLEQIHPLVETLTHVSNFAMEPLKIQAFFKKTDQGMLLDWDVFMQTRFRAFKGFMEPANPGATGIFRVMIVEDVNLLSDQDEATNLVYRIGDPAYINDSYRVKVPRSSQTAKDLAKINWRGQENVTPRVTTATVELEHSNNGEVMIKRLICWEFDGLGGGAGATQNHTPNKGEILQDNEMDSNLDQPIEMRRPK